MVSENINIQIVYANYVHGNIALFVCQYLWFCSVYVNIFYVVKYILNIYNNVMHSRTIGNVHKSIIATKVAKD